MLRTASIALAAMLAPLAASAEVNGPARVIDAGNIEIAGQTIRLFGVAAPATDQLCERGGTWRCGQDAAWALAERLELHWVLCDDKGDDASGVMLGVCYLGGRNGIEVNAWLVEQGWAVADRSASQAYVPQEETARAARRGLWSGTFPGLRRQPAR